ncbi:MAG TPA: DUF6600 domain-containing protein [Pelobium sp.]|nr:DUF6600 domain-containing protein [Pelobium sp.]
MGNGIKKTAWAFGIFFILISLGTNNVQAQPNRGISLQVFYDELSYYGDWVNNPEYGYVWRPNVGSDFRPYYTNGHWVMTEYGNTWVSDYNWGWAPFHYGRWFYDDYDGWIWMPDTEWGPAWVTWRTGGGYYGWAPLGPRISININIGRRHYVPDNYWVFIPQRCIYYPSYSRYWEPRRNVYIIHNTTIINNIYTNDRVRYYSGPGRDDVRRATRRDVPVYRIADNSRPGSDRVGRGAVSVYRPSVDRSGNSAPRSIASNSARPSRADNSNSRTVNNDRSVSSTARPDRSSAPDSRSSYGNVSRTESSRGNSSSNSSSRPERAEAPRPTSPSPRTTESTRSSAPSSSPQRSEAPSSRPQRVERSSPSVQSSSPSRSTQRSSAPSSSSSRSSSSSSRGGGNGRPSR